MTLASAGAHFRIWWRFFPFFPSSGAFFLRCYSVFCDVLPSHLFMWVGPRVSLSPHTRIKHITYIYNTHYILYIHTNFLPPPPGRKAAHSPPPHRHFIPPIREFLYQCFTTKYYIYVECDTRIGWPGWKLFFSYIRLDLNILCLYYSNRKNVVLI